MFTNREGARYIRGDLEGFFFRKMVKGGYQRINAPTSKEKRTTTDKEVDWRYRISNDKLREITNTLPTRTFCQSHHIKYLGHICRLGNRAIQKQLLFDTRTLVAAGHVTTQKLGGRKVYLKGGATGFSSLPNVLEYPPTLRFWMDRWSRGQPQPGSLFQRLRGAEIIDPGNEGA